jgi:hypothetical protein
MNFSTMPIQAKLKVGAVNDPLEYDADRIATQVMRTPNPSPVAAQSASPPRRGPSSLGDELRRKCIGSCSAGHDECEDCKNHDGTIQRSAVADGAHETAPRTIHNVMRSAGKPLDTATRAFFEPRFAYDFGRVRVHTDGTAATSAQAMQAQAYTVGNHIVFADRQYSPDSGDGRTLLAHELAHVIQQGPTDRAVDTATASHSGIGNRIQLKPARSSPPAAKSPSRPAPIVEDGQQLLPGQMQKSQFLTTLRDTLINGCEAELVPFGKTAKGCPYILRTIDRYAGRPVSSLMRIIHAFGNPSPGADAHGLIDAVTRNARIVARRLAEKHADRLQTATQSGRTELPRHDPGSIRAQLGGGRPLERPVRERMQHAFGEGFASVRVHDDSSAARLNTTLDARAFTIGEHIAFAEGQYRPGTVDGDTLIAHELSHAIQQRTSRTPSSPTGANGDHELEREADRTASAAIAGRHLPGEGSQAASPQVGDGGAWVQRWPAVVAAGLELGEVAVVTEVAAVSTTEIVMVDGALTVGAEVLTPVALETVAPVALETGATVALETGATTAAATSSSSALTTAAVVGTGVAATTLSSDSPTSEEQDKRRDCMRENPYAIPCEDELPIDEQVVDWIMRQGYGFESLGDCVGFRSHGLGEVAACNGAPGESWHCNVEPYLDPISRTSKPGGIVSIFSCLCCRANGTVGFEWRGAHWSSGAP